MGRTIYSEPTGGLCNRMGALNYAWLFAREYGCDLVVLWKNNFEAACDLEDVFPDFAKRAHVNVTVRNLDYYKETPKELMKSGRVWAALARCVRHAAYSLYFKYRYGRELKFKYETDGLDRGDANAFNHKVFEGWLASGRKWCTISSYQCADLTHDYSVLEFAHGYQAAVDELLARELGKCGVYFAENYVQGGTGDNMGAYLRKNVVGVHVRRGDHQFATEQNPLEGFVSKMGKVLSDNPDTLFYLASDGQDVIDRMREEFPGKIMVNSGASLTRKSKAGMDGAVIDLLALSRTGRIIGSFGSTFSDMASYIGRIGLEYSNMGN